MKLYAHGHIDHIIQRVNFVKVCAHGHIDHIYLVCIVIGNLVHGAHESRHGKKGAATYIKEYDFIKRIFYKMLDGSLIDKSLLDARDHSAETSVDGRRVVLSRDNTHYLSPVVREAYLICHEVGRSRSWNLSFFSKVLYGNLAIIKFIDNYLLTYRTIRPHNRIVFRLPFQERIVDYCYDHWLEICTRNPVHQAPGAFHPSVQICLQTTRGRSGIGSVYQGFYGRPAACRQQDVGTGMDHPPVGLENGEGLPQVLLAVAVEVDDVSGEGSVFKHDLAADGRRHLAGILGVMAGGQLHHYPVQHHRRPVLGDFQHPLRVDGGNGRHRPEDQDRRRGVETAVAHHDVGSPLLQPGHDAAGIHLGHRRVG